MGRVRSYAGINGIASVTLQYQISCIQDAYYGQNCDIFCSPQNDSINGYYDCDRITGDKICLEGYNGINCLGIANIKAVKNAITSTQSQPLLYSSTTGIVSMDRISTTDITANETISVITTSTQSTTLSQPLLYSSITGIVSMDRVSTTDITANETISVITTSTQSTTLSQPLLYSSTTGIVSMDRISTTDITANETISVITTSTRSISTSTQSQPLLYNSTIGMEKVSTTSSSTNIVGSGQYNYYNYVKNNLSECFL